MNVGFTAQKNPQNYSLKNNSNKQVGFGTKMQISTGISSKFNTGESKELDVFLKKIETDGINALIKINTPNAGAVKYNNVWTAVNADELLINHGTPLQQIKSIYNQVKESIK